MPRWILIFLISAFFVFNLLVFSKPALAQDAIQCTPGDINLNRNLKFVNNGNIYLGTGKLNFSSGDNNLYAANDGGNLLLKSPAAILLQSSGDFKFQNSSGNVFAQFFTGATPSLAGAGNLLVNGNIEGLGAVQGNQVCVTGSGTQCVSSWSQICDPAGAGKCNTVETSNNIKSGTDLSANGNIYTVNGNIIGKQLCIQGACISNWADVMNNGSGGSISMTNNALTIENGGSLVMNPGSTFQICDGAGNCSTGQGVSKIIAGSGITISSLPNTGNPGSGIGDVTISSKIIWCNRTCPVW